METKKKVQWKIWLLRILLSLLCVGVFAWIFSNSLQTGEASSEKSEAVVDAVQNAAGVIAPDSFVATAKGEDRAFLHAVIRNFAHFAEFALLGALLTWCYFSYTRSKAFAFLPVALVWFTPIIDEFLQAFSSGRASELTDIFVDTAGGVCGILFAALTLVVGFWIHKSKRKKRIG